MTVVFILIETTIYADVYIEPTYINTLFLLGCLIDKEYCISNFRNISNFYRIGGFR